MCILGTCAVPLVVTLPACVPGYSPLPPTGGEERKKCRPLDVMRDRNLIQDWEELLRELVWPVYSVASNNDHNGKLIIVNPSVGPFFKLHSQMHNNIELKSILGNTLTSYKEPSSLMINIVSTYPKRFEHACRLCWD